MNNCLALWTTGALVLACGMARAEGEPGLLLRLTKSVSCEASPGDMIVVAVPSNPSTGPNNPAAKLKVEVEGAGLSAKTYVVSTPPAPRRPGAPGEIQAYVPVEGPGNATLTVTPISGKGKPGKPLVFKVTVAADADAPG
jgi:hypothetical protein